MTLSDLMTGITPNASFEGPVTADDMVLAVDLESAASIGGYIVAQKYVSEHSGTIESESQDSQYIRTGKTNTRTGAVRVITVNGDRYVGDDFQDKMLGHAIKYGKGASVIVDYIYFNIKNGKGEKGKVTIDVTEDASGAAGENASFTATLRSVGTPDDYTYA